MPAFLLLAACTASRTPEGPAPAPAAPGVIIVETGGKPATTTAFVGGEARCRFTRPRELRWLGDAVAVRNLGGWDRCDLRGFSVSTASDPGGTPLDELPPTASGDPFTGEVGDGYRIDLLLGDATPEQQAAGQVPAVLYLPDGRKHPLGRRPVTRVWVLPGDAVSRGGRASPKLDGLTWPLAEGGAPLAGPPEGFQAAPEPPADTVARWRADLERLRPRGPAPQELALAATLDLDNDGDDEGLVCQSLGGRGRCDIAVDGGYAYGPATLGDDQLLGLSAFRGADGAYLAMALIRREGPRRKYLVAVTRYDGRRYTTEEVFSAPAPAPERAPWTHRCAAGEKVLIACGLPDGVLSVCLDGEPTPDARVSLRVERRGQAREATEDPAYAERTELDAMTAQTLEFPEAGAKVEWQRNPRTTEAVALSWEGIVLCDTAVEGDWDALQRLR